MYKKVLKREKYEGTFEWFKAYSKYDEDNLKSALTEWREDDVPEQKQEDLSNMHLGSMPAFMAEQIKERESQI